MITPEGVQTLGLQQADKHTSKNVELPVTTRHFVSCLALKCVRSQQLCRHLVCFSSKKSSLAFMTAIGGISMKLCGSHSSNAYLSHVFRVQQKCCCYPQITFLLVCKISPTFCPILLHISRSQIRLQLHLKFGLGSRLGKRKRRIWDIQNTRLFYEQTPSHVSRGRSNANE